MRCISNLYNESAKVVKDHGNGAGEGENLRAKALRLLSPVRYGIAIVTTLWSIAPQFET